MNSLKRLTDMDFGTIVRQYPEVKAFLGPITPGLHLPNVPQTVEVYCEACLLSRKDSDVITLSWVPAPGRDSDKGVSRS